MILSYLFALAGILMLNRKVYLYMAPVLIGMSWRFGTVVGVRNFTVDEMLVLVSIIKILQYLIVGKFEYRMPILRWHIIYLLGVAFTFSIGIMVFQSYDPDQFRDTILVHAKERLYTPVVYAAVFILIRDSREGLALLRWAALIGIPISIYAIIQYHWVIIPRAGEFGSFWLYAWYDETEFWKVYSMSRTFGTIGHPGSFGRYAMFIIILGLVQGIHGLENTPPWRIGLVVAFLAFYTLGTSGSRGPMLSVVVGVAAIIYLERKSFSRNLIVLLFSAIAVTYAVPTVMAERMETAMEEREEESNVAARFDMWAAHTNDVLSNNPVTGYGFMKAGDCYDSDFVGILYEGGFVLVILFILWLLAIYRLGIVGTISDSRLSQMCGIIVISSLVVMMGAGSSGRTFFGPKVSLEFIYILAVCARVIVLQNRRHWQEWLAQREREQAGLS